MILAPGQVHAYTFEMVTSDPHDLQATQDRDKVMPPRLPAYHNEAAGRVDQVGERANMTEETVDLDKHRGMAAQKATDLRRLLADVEASAKALRLRQDELEAHLLAAPAANWHEAAEKARYLLNLFAASLDAQDPRRQKLIAAVIDDFERLAREA